MDDLTEKLNSLLNNPEALSLALQNARQLLGEKEDAEPTLENNDNIGLNTQLDTGKLIKIISAVKSPDLSSDTALLQALKPHLSPERAAKVDTALKILKLIKIAPLLMEGLDGIF